ncbi:branched-chain amino acid transport system II carrier protein [Peribacillus frigoritolerans]|uniref:branched-chain amino acid transport system II carrier protein n=1 Tax=Peribacillus frigoritolerans TaxID=450367 RepID=UPI00227DA2FA|nr:branched-chain amino acid transport system II carrier protein [Peribacillus frigoritolerans]MCY9002437.1 branched-chain amino acid transport system II carrier protein [Peribacillus frigoritolerans]
MNKTLRDTLIFGFSLFALFFGAGNLIFPPSIGLVSGTDWPIALVGFFLTGIIFPMLGVPAILNSKGKLEVLTQPISPWFYKVFNTIIWLGLGMFVSIPRTAATTHELGVHTLFPHISPFFSSLIFFALTFYFAMDKSNFIEKMGKILTPLLFVLLLFIVFKGFFDPIATPIITELKNPFYKAFIGGYQTGDLLTGLLCTSVFIAGIRSQGYTESSSIKRITINGTLIASVGLFIVYGGLLYLGATGSGLYSNDIDNTLLVIGLVNNLLGNYGSLVLAIIVSLACLTTAIGLTAAGSDFLSHLTNQRVSYRMGVLLFSIVGVIVSSLGVETIINYSQPVYSAIYPVSIVLVFLGIFRKYVPNAGAYKGAAILTISTSLIETIGIFGKVEFFNYVISLLPFSSNGFSWIVPAISGFLLGMLINQLFANSPGTNIDIELEGKQ